MSGSSIPYKVFEAHIKHKPLVKQIFNEQLFKLSAIPLHACHVICMVYAWVILWHSTEAIFYMG